jgi:vibriolysin
VAILLLRRMTIFTTTTMEKIAIKVMTKYIYLNHIRWLIGWCCLGFTVSVTAVNLENIQPEGVDNTWSSKIANPLLSMPFTFSKDGWRLETSQTDKVSTLHKRFQQTYMGIPLFGYRIATHEQNHILKRINGVVVEGLDSEIKTTTPKLKRAAASEQAHAFFLTEQNNSNDWLFSKEKIELVIYVDEVSQQAKLAYYVKFFAENSSAVQVSQPHLIIDALDGTLLKHWEGLNHDKIGTGPGGNIRMLGAPYYYGTTPNYDFLDVTVKSDGKKKTCSLETKDVMTILDPDTKAFSYKCFDGKKNLDSNYQIKGAFSPLNDAHYAGQKTFDLYREWYGVNVLPFQLQIYMYPGGYDMAYWDGAEIILGDGNIYFHPLVSLDVVAHEISHGFTESNSDLIYTGQAGGINEAFSDMAGVTAKFYVFGKNDEEQWQSDPTSWQIGTYMTKEDGPFKGKPIRDMCDPPADIYCQGSYCVHSIDHADDYYRGMDVHYSSGVFNKAFCQLAQKNGWGIRKAFEVMVEANRNYWAPNVNFEDAACGVEMATENLGYNVFDVYDAFLQVGVEANCGLVLNTNCLATYSNETQQATIPCLEVPLYTDVDGEPFFTNIDGQSLPLTGLYSAVLDMQSGFADIQMAQFHWIDIITQPNADYAKFIPNNGILDIPNIYVPADLIYPDTPVDKLIQCHVSLQQFMFEPGTFQLRDDYSCNLQF